MDSKIGINKSDFQSQQEKDKKMKTQISHIPCPSTACQSRGLSNKVDHANWLGEGCLQAGFCRGTFSGLAYSVPAIWIRGPGRMTMILSLRMSMFHTPPLLPTGVKRSRVKDPLNQLLRKKAPENPQTKRWKMLKSKGRKTVWPLALHSFTF